MRLTKASKWGMTRRWGRRPSPAVTPRRGFCSEGTHDVRAIAPALHPAKAAPRRHASTMAAHTAVSRNVSAKYAG